MKTVNVVLKQTITVNVPKDFTDQMAAAYAEKVGQNFILWSENDTEVFSELDNHSSSSMDEALVQEIREEF